MRGSRETTEGDGGAGAAESRGLLYGATGAVSSVKGVAIVTANAPVGAVSLVDTAAAPAFSSGIGGFVVNRSANGAALRNSEVTDTVLGHNNLRGRRRTGLLLGWRDVLRRVPDGRGVVF